MSRNLNNPSETPRDYGATSSSATNPVVAAANLPDVNFSGFSPTEFMSLSEDIANNITAVNTTRKQLEKVLRVIGTPRDQQSTRDMVENTHTETNARIEATTKDLQRLNAIVRRGDKQQSLQLEKLTNDFCTVIEKYSAVQQRIAIAMRKALTKAQQAQLQDDQAESDRAELMQRQREIAAGMQFEQEMLIDRERQIKQIESNVLDVNATMRKISTYLQAQRQQVEQIEVNIDNTGVEVDLGRQELEKAAQHRRSYRRKILILLVIAVIIGLIVTGIIVAKVTS